MIYLNIVKNVFWQLICVAHVSTVVGILTDQRVSLTLIHVRLNVNSYRPTYIIFSSTQLYCLDVSITRRANMPTCNRTS